MQRSFTTGSPGLWAVVMTKSLKFHSSNSDGQPGWMTSCSEKLWFFFRRGGEGFAIGLPLSLEDASGFDHRWKWSLLSVLKSVLWPAGLPRLPPPPRRNWRMWAISHPGHPLATRALIWYDGNCHAYTHWNSGGRWGGDCNRLRASRPEETGGGTLKKTTNASRVGYFGYYDFIP